MMILIGRLGKGYFVIPSEVDYSAVECALADTKPLRPYVHAESFSTKRDEARSSRIRGLFSLRSPSNVAGLISTRVVDSVDTVMWRRSSANVGQKGLERIPLGADLNPPSSIALKIGRTGIAATMPHRTPDPIFRSSGHRVDPSPGVGFGDSLISQASTRRGMAGTQIMEGRDKGATAVTETAHADMPRPDTRVPCDREATILDSDSDFASSHVPSYYISLEKVRT